MCGVDATFVSNNNINNNDCQAYYLWLSALSDENQATNETVQGPLTSYNMSWTVVQEPQLFCEDMRPPPLILTLQESETFSSFGGKWLGQDEQCPVKYLRIFFRFLLLEYW